MRAKAQSGSELMNWCSGRHAVLNDLSSRFDREFIISKKIKQIFDDETMSKFFKIALQCPICRRGGIVYIRLLNDRLPIKCNSNIKVVSVPTGFVEVYREVSSWGANLGFECVEHAISAVSGS